MKTWTREARYQRLDQYSPTEYAALEQKVAQAPWRQHYHIQPPTGLLNDPNGFCFDGERYHLFYQWFPLGAVHGLKYWRALQSQDLITFQDKGIAIAPDTQYDSHGAYSGSALANPDGSLTIAYTGNHRSVDWQRTPYQLIAHYEPTTQRLTREAPFLSGPPQGYTEHVRDPKIWRDTQNQLWAILGAQRDNGTGTALLCKNGQYCGELHTQLPNFGYMWECPDFFTLNGQSILIFSPQGLPAQADGRYANLFQTGYLCGTYDSATHTLQHGEFQELDHGFDFYAAQTCEGKHGERILIAWMGLPDTTYPSDADDWQGCLTLPRVLTLKNGKLYQTPLPALQQQRKTKINAPQALTVGELQLDNPEGKAFTIELFKNQTHSTKLHFDGNTFTLDRCHSGALPTVSLTPIPAGKNTHIRQLKIAVKALNIFIDNSSIEIFINDGEATMSARIFPPKDAQGISYQGEGKLYVWEYI